jgi:glycine/D-amino acid oxidase-like deaminating enzyme
MNIPQQSVWRGTVDKRNFPALDRTIDTDVAVIGGGLTGIVTAYLLRTSGKKVTVIEADTLGNAATGLTTAFLLETIDTEASQLITLFGEEKAKQILAAHRGAISWIETTALAENIDCEFKRCPLYDYATDEKEAEEIKKDVVSGKRLGVPVEFREQSEIPFIQHGYAYTENQGKYHPFKFMFALADIACAAGVEIFEHTRITSLEENHRIILRHDKGEVRADHVLIATHYPEIDDEQPFSLFFKKAKYITYVFEVRRPKQSLPEGIYEDIKNPYHYIRVALIYRSTKKPISLPLRHIYKKFFRKETTRSLKNGRGPLLSQEMVSHISALFMRGAKLCMPPDIQEMG